MSRSVILNAIETNSDLNAAGINENTVFASYSKEIAPVTDGPFVILRWFEHPKQQGFDGPRVLEVWAHMPEKLSTDYGHLDNILNLVDRAILPLTQVVGEDGYYLTEVTPSGKSRDLVDRTYKTITRNASYGVLYHLAP